MSAGYHLKVSFDHLLKLAETLDETLDRSTDKSAEHMLGSVKKRAPVDSGRMRDGYYKAKTGKAQREVRSGDDLEYPLYVEVGTSRMRAQPHFIPAAQETETAMVDIFSGALREWAGGS